MASPIASSSSLPGATAPQCSLLLAHRPQGRLVVILGSGKLAYSRAKAAHEAGGVPVVVVRSDDAEQLCSDVQDGVRQGWIQVREGAKDDGCWGQWLDALDHAGDDAEDTDEPRIFAVCITDTLHAGDGQEQGKSAATSTRHTRSQTLHALCKRRRIPINVADTPALCDFSFPASHRYPASSLQVAVTTNGRGCRLAGRIRRDVVAALPRNVGQAVESVGWMRDLARKDGGGGNERRPEGEAAATDYISSKSRTTTRTQEEEEDLSYDTTPLNSPVPQLSAAPTSQPPHLLHRASSRLHAHAALETERRKRRMRWVAQISEYWPIEYLGAMDEAQMRDALRSLGEDPERGRRVVAGDEEESKANHDRSVTPRAPSGDDDSERGRARSTTTTAHATQQHRARSQHSLSIVPPPPPPRESKGHIYLIGSGPGHPGLLTLLAHRLLTSPTTHLVLSDKLVPSAILRLIPSTTPLIIAKKFPGNAEGAQTELISLALEAALQRGHNVIRLKQGDPFVYGRGGEEVLAFRQAGIECTVVPGISSALAAPLMLGVPVTQRGSADSLVLCTGVGRGGKKVKLPGYQRSRTLLILMGVARLNAVIDILIDPQTSDRNGAPFPPHTPIAIIERASSSDQRILASTLDRISIALDKCGEQRPPGMIMIGWAVLALEGEHGNVDVLHEEEDMEKDLQRVKSWLGDDDFIMREGLDEVYSTALVELTAGSYRDEHEEQQNRDSAGWARPRYPLAMPFGGWGEGEQSVRGGGE